MAMLLLAYGCGGRARSDGAAGRSVASAGSGATSAGSGGEPSEPNSQGGGGAGGGGGASTRATKQCPMLHGQLAYGPIGEPQPLPLTVGSFAGCPRCVGARDIFGFRTAPGYGFVWRVGFDPNGPGPNLFNWTADPDFKGGEPLPLVAENTANDLAVVPAPNGFVAATCSLNSELQWIELNHDLDVAGGSSVVVPDAPCSRSIFWTGKVYVTAFADSRGLVLASLDEQGALVEEKILSAGAEEPVVTSFSKNGDRVLFVFSKNRKRAWYVVLDLRGAPLGAAQPFGEESSFVSSLALVPAGDGWWVASDGMVTNETGAQLTGISRDGLVWRERRVLSGFAQPSGFTPSAYGGSLLVATMDSGGEYGALFNLTALIDDAGEVVYTESKQLDGFDFDGSIQGVVIDALRDLVIRPLPLEGSERTIVVQEYGCLD